MNDATKRRLAEILSSVVEADARKWARDDRGILQLNGIESDIAHDAAVRAFAAGARTMLDLIDELQRGTLIGRSE